MITSKTLDHFFDTKKDIGVILLRLIIGWRLIDGTQDNIFSWERMLEFRDFLHQFNVPFPLFSAQLSVYAQFICGIFFIIGFLTRWSAIVMIINFLAAIYIVHLGDTFQQSFDAWMMLFASLFFLFYGSGKYSVDYLIIKKKKN